MVSDAVTAAAMAWKMRKMMERADMAASCQAIVRGRWDELGEAAHGQRCSQSRD